MQDKPDLMLVDDDPTIIQALGQILGGFARLRFARSAADAERLVSEQAPALMLLDAEMPGMGGLELLRRLKGKSDRPPFPVIVVTSHRGRDWETAALEAGAVDFLSKPIEATKVLPRVQAHLRLAAPRDGAGLMPDRVRMSVLVVDDDVSAIELLQWVLAPLVEQIRFATDGASALRLMAQQAPDLVLLDGQMPGLDGFAVVEAMRADPKLQHVPIALVTRVSDPITEARALELGATDFIAKPYQPAVLLARVRNLLRLKKDRDDALQAMDEHWKRLGDSRVAEILAVASDAILSVDADGGIVLINAAACKLFGVESQGVLGQPLEHALPGARGLAEVLADMEVPAALNASREVAQRVVIDPDKGESVTLEPSVFRMGDGSGRVTTLVLKDVTQRDRLERLERESQQREAAAKAKAMMSAYLAHEIGNPLNGISGVGELMQMDLLNPLPSAQAERLMRLMASTRHLQMLMRDVMEVIRLEANAFQVQMQGVNVCKALKEACEIVLPQAETAGVRIVVDAMDPHVQVAADVGRLQQCLVNLLSNAVKYGRQHTACAISVLPQEAGVRIEVRDQGIGMSSDQIEHLFEPFNRLGREKSGAQGTGLGLLITKLLVQAMGGRLSVKSKPGQGSSFYIDLQRGS
ncbi:response regulator [Roseateles sp.]|uniref:hybrid sensor histidine kinase/response regulator n=1 Tax=Roseateles sp. TaxID=1971397 RepID=UPI0039E9180C